MIIIIIFIFIIIITIGLTLVDEAVIINVKIAVEAYVEDPEEDSGDIGAIMRVYRRSRIKFQQAKAAYKFAR